jgi:hypothetical protein
MFCWKGENNAALKLEFEVPNRDQTCQMLINTAEKIRRDRFKPDIIIGASSGGRPPTRTLSDIIDNANLANVRAESRLGVAETKSESALTQTISAVVANKRALTVDEIVDTWKSPNPLKEQARKDNAEEPKIAAVYYRPWSVVRSNYYEKETMRLDSLSAGGQRNSTESHQDERRKSSTFRRKTRKLAEAGVPAELVKRFSMEVLEEESC